MQKSAPEARASVTRAPMPRPAASEEEIAAIRSAVLAKLTLDVGKNPDNASDRDWFVAAALAVRDRIVFHWVETNRRVQRRNGKRVYYLSLEFLIGRLLRDFAHAFGLSEALQAALGDLGVNVGRWWRRGENFQAIRYYEKVGIPIYDMVTAGVFEGGDFNVIEEGCVLIGCGGERTQEEAVQQIKSWLDKEGWEVRITYFDPFYVHIDLMVVMIAEKLAAVCLETTAPDVVAWLKAKKIDIIPVPFQDTVTLGCNVMSLGKDRVIAPRHSRTLIEALKARGFTVAEMDMSEISKTGGGIHCMAQALRREEA